MRSYREGKSRTLWTWIRWPLGLVVFLFILTIPMYFPPEGERWYLVPIGFLRGFSTPNRGALLASTPSGRALLKEFAGNYPGFYNHFSISEDGSYEFASYSCFSIESLSTGRLGFENGILYPHQVVAIPSWGNGFGYRFVKWGDVHLLLTDDSIRGLANALNSGQDFYRLFCRVRLEDRGLQPHGTPEVPPEFRKFFKLCVDGRVVSRGQADFSIDKGLKDGLKPGMAVRVLACRLGVNVHSADGNNWGVFKVVRASDHNATCAMDKKAEVPHVRTRMTSRVPRELLE